MKKRITRFKLEELAKEMPILSEDAKRGIIAGKAYSVDQNGNFTEISGGLNDNYISWNNNGVTGFIQISSNTTIKNIISNDPMTGKTSSGTLIEGASVGTFKELANHTNVEWACSCNRIDKNNDPCIINTSHNTGAVLPVLRSGYSTLVHNHQGIDTTSDPQKPIVESYDDDSSAVNILYHQYRGTSATNYKNFDIYAEDTGETTEYNTNVKAAAKKEYDTYLKSQQP